MEVMNSHAAVPHTECCLGSGSGLKNLTMQADAMLSIYVSWSANMTSSTHRWHPFMMAQQAGTFGWLWPWLRAEYALRKSK
jgi:hypothetical protein